MSLIDQALKKTQSSLHKQNTKSPRAPIYSATTTQIPLAAQRVANPYKRKNIADSSFKLSAINKYWIIGSLSLVLIAIIGFETHGHFAMIKQSYANFYGKIFSNFSLKPKKISPIISTQPLILNGTMKMDSERVVLINDTLYHVGQTVNGYQIKQIHYNHVILQNTSTGQALELTPELTD